MATDWLAIALSDLGWIFTAFVFGFLSRTAGLPPLVGFLAAGFMLNALGTSSGETLEKFSDLGITLLLFSVGLKLNIRSLAQPQVWAVSGLHMAASVMVGAVVLMVFSAIGIVGGFRMDFQTALLLGFALSFSSTVLVVKILEDRSQGTSLHGRLSIGILIMQDLAAVLFLAFSTGKVPTIWALAVIALLFPLRHMLFLLMNRAGHGELLVLLGLLIALGGAQLFEAVGLKGDVGALAFGAMLAGHQKADELNKTLLGFKDLFLLGFFLSIGMGGSPDGAEFLLALALLPFIYLKGGLFFVLFTRFRLRARTSLMASLNLSNFSEFGLIVTVVSVRAGWLDYSWLTVLAIALSLSFVSVAVISRFTETIYSRFGAQLRRFQTRERVPEDRPVEIKGVSWAVVGMGGVGSGAYDQLVKRHPGRVIGVDIDPLTVRAHVEAGRSVLWGDPADAEFWDRVEKSEQLHTVMLALPDPSLSLAVVGRLRQMGFSGKIAAVARYPDEAESLSAEGADQIYSLHTEAGTGFAAHVMGRRQKKDSL